MPFRLRVDKEFFGPTLCEMEPVLEILNPDRGNPTEVEVEVRWTGDRRDNLAYERNSEYAFVLVVPDIETAEKTSWSLGGAMDLPQAELEAAEVALFSKAGSGVAWRKKAEGLGAVRATLLLTKVAADAVRRGKRPRVATALAADCIINHVSPADADVLLRLRLGRI